MSSHCTGVAETKIYIAVTVHVEQMRPLRLADKRRISAGPLHHPIHRDAGQQRLASALKQRLRFRTLVHKLLLLTFHQRLQAGTVNGFHALGL